jgi:hypothetical protein
MAVPSTTLDYSPLSNTQGLPHQATISAVLPPINGQRSLTPLITKALPPSSPSLRSVAAGVPLTSLIP